jgi:hypothetical protein
MLKDWFIRLMWCGALLFILLGCSRQSSPLKWTEDVRLPDGRVVTLTRYQEFKGPHELGAPPTESDYWFEFKHPDTGQVVRWQSDRDLSTMALMMDGKLPVLLVMPNFGGVYRNNCPNPPYLLFKFDGAWKQIPVTEIPVKRFRVNMTFGPTDSRREIKLSNYYLTAEQTSKSYHKTMPYIINFDLMKEQIFGIQNCGRETNWLVDKEKRK